MLRSFPDLIEKSLRRERPCPAAGSDRDAAAPRPAYLGWRSLPVHRSQPVSGYVSLERPLGYAAHAARGP